MLASGFKVRRNRGGVKTLLKSVAHEIDLQEYLTNTKALLGLDHARWRVVVERQVQAQVLPNVKGTRVELEPQLWALLVLCLDGHLADVPELTEAGWERGVETARKGSQLGGDGNACYPRAALAVVEVMEQLREAGIYPPPLV